MLLAALSLCPVVGGMCEGLAHSPVALCVPSCRGHELALPSCRAEMHLDRNHVLIY